MLNSCFVLVVDSPLTDFDMHQSWEAQNVAVARALACWSDQCGLGSNSTPRYLYDKTGRAMLNDVVLSALGLSRVRTSRMWSYMILESSLARFLKVWRESYAYRAIKTLCQASPSYPLALSGTLQLCCQWPTSWSHPQIPKRAHHWKNTLTSGML